MLSKECKEFSKRIEDIPEEELQELLNDVDVQTLAYAFRKASPTALDKLLSVIKVDYVKKMLLDIIQQMNTDASARSLSAEKANRLKILEKLKH